MGTSSVSCATLRGATTTSSASRRWTRCWTTTCAAGTFGDTQAVDYGVGALLELYPCDSADPVPAVHTDPHRAAGDSGDNRVNFGGAAVFAVSEQAGVRVVGGGDILFPLRGGVQGGAVREGLCGAGVRDWVR